MNCEVSIMARTRLGWMKFRECGELLMGKRYLLKIKERIYHSCVRLVMLCERKIWCLRERELVILQRTERAMIRAMYKVKMMDRKNTDKLMDRLGLDETMDKMVWSCFEKKKW